MITGQLEFRSGSQKSNHENSRKILSILVFETRLSKRLISLVQEEQSVERIVSSAVLERSIGPPTELRERNNSIFYQLNLLLAQQNYSLHSQNFNFVFYF